MAEPATAPARIGSEDGFTLIELLIAAMIAAVALIALVGTFDFSRDTIGSAEKMETAVHIGQQELERIGSSTYASIGLTSTPAHMTDKSDPRYYVVAPSSYQWDSTAPSKVEQLVTTEGMLSPSSSWSTGTPARLDGKVWRFVTWVYDPNVVQTPDQPEAKRVTVAVTVTGTPRPVVLSSIVFDRKSPT